MKMPGFSGEAAFRNPPGHYACAWRQKNLWANEQTGHRPV
jgi:hypothetical protein